MSTNSFPRIYITVIILTLLFGVGLGYQLHMVISDADDDQINNTQTQNTNGERLDSAASPITTAEVYFRSGTVENVSDGKIVFSSYVQNTSGSFVKTSLTASFTENATMKKILRGSPDVAPSTITLSDIKVGDEIAVESEDNLYGKTIFSATSLTLYK